MKNIAPKLSLALLLSLLFPLLLFAQSTIKKTDIDVTKYAILTPYYNLISSNSGTQKPNLIETAFYPLGFSKDGKFAYIIIPPDEAQGFLTVNLIVQNLVNDHIIFKKKYQFDDFDNNGLATNQPTNFKEFILRYKNKIEQIKKRYHIASQSPFFISCFNDLKLTAKRTFQDQDGLGNFLSHFNLKMHNKAGESKTIYNEAINGYTLNTAIAGFFASPYEERVAIVLLNIRRGWEGPPNTTTITIVGASLTSGFY